MEIVIEIINNTYWSRMYKEVPKVTEKKKAIVKKTFISIVLRFISSPYLSNIPLV